MPGILAVAAGVVLVAVLGLSMSRRQDRNAAIGMLDRQARKQDRQPAPEEALGGPAVIPGREVERAAAAQRRSAGIVLRSRADPVLVPAPSTLDEEALGVTRRQFLNRSILGMAGLATAGFAASVLGFLWPRLGAGFGSKFNVGNKHLILAKIQAAKAPVYIAEARTYLNPYPAVDLAKAKSSGAYAPPIIAGMEAGLVALYQKCPHLGCRVPWCQTSQWFECPCHGSQYNRVGEKKGGPAPRGMDRFAISFSHGDVIVDTKNVFLGPPIGTNTTGQEAEGPHCR